MDLPVFAIYLDEAAAHEDRLADSPLIRHPLARGVTPFCSSDSMLRIDAPLPSVVTALMSLTAAACKVWEGILRHPWLAGLDYYNGSKLRFLPITEARIALRAALRETWRELTQRHPFLAMLDARARKLHAKREAEAQRLSLLEFEKSDLKLKDRLDYAYRKLLMLRDFCLGLGIFFATSIARHSQCARELPGQGLVHEIRLLHHVDLKRVRQLRKSIPRYAYPRTSNLQLLRRALLGGETPLKVAVDLEGALRPKASRKQRTRGKPLPCIHMSQCMHWNRRTHSRGKDDPIEPAARGLRQRYSSSPNWRDVCLACLGDSPDQQDQSRSVTDLLISSSNSSWIRATSRTRLWKEGRK